MRTLFLLLMFTFAQSANAQNRIGTSPSDDYHLPNTIGIYSEIENTISTCASFVSDGVYTSFSGNFSLGLTFRLDSVNPPLISYIESSAVNNSNSSTESGEAIECSGIYDIQSNTYRDVVEVASIPYQLTMQLRDPETLQFEVVNNFPIRKSKTQKDIALVLVGYGGDTYYPTTESFSGVAEKSIDYLSKLSFGEVSTYELFDGGIVEESGVYFSSLQDIRSINSFLASPESFSAEEISVLESLKQWLITSEKGAKYGWGETELGALHLDAWVWDRVLAYGYHPFGISSGPFFERYRTLPATLEPNDFRSIGFILSTPGTVTWWGGLMSPCSSRWSDGNFFYVLDKDGNELEDPRINCFYADASDSGFISELSDDEKFESSTSTIVHEFIHTLGHYGHDTDITGGFDFNYGVMSYGAADQYPAWNRIFMHDWLPETAITEDPTEIVDLKNATDPNLKYLLKLGPESDYECFEESQFGRKKRLCHTYQELYDGSWIQYKAGPSNNPMGVVFEPLNDPKDKIPPKAISTGDIYVRVERTGSSDVLKIEFDDLMSFGTGLVTLMQIDGYSSLGYNTSRSPSTSTSALKLEGNTMVLQVHPGPVDYVESKYRTFRLIEGREYELTISPGTFTDRAGNSIEQARFRFSVQ